MAAKKKPKNKAKPKRPAAKPQRKSKPAAKPAAKRVQPKASRPAVSKAAKRRAKVAKPQPEESPQPIAVIPPPAVAPTLVRPGLQKRADLAPIGVVRVTDGFQLIEESTFYSAPGRDEYVQRWSARGYSCRFTPTNNEGR